MIKTLLTKSKNILWKRPDEREFIFKYFPKNAICAEIGVWKGDFSEKIVAQTNPTRLHLIDGWMHIAEFAESIYGTPNRDQAFMDAMFERVRNKFKKQIDAGIVVLNRGLSEEISKKFENNYFDWIYIDANHSYEYVKDDLECYFPKVKKGGLICGDDYAEGGWWDGGVKKAVDEFVENGLVRIITIQNNQFVLEKLT